MTELSTKQCKPCAEGAEALSGPALDALVAQLDGWEVVDGHHLAKSYAFEDFATALAFVNRLGAVAEGQGHHPDIALAWGRVGIAVFTHDIGGLSENDFILAARIDDVR